MRPGRGPGARMIENTSRQERERTRRDGADRESLTRGAKDKCAACERERRRCIARNVHSTCDCVANSDRASACPAIDARGKVAAVQQADSRAHHRYPQISRQQRRKRQPATCGEVRAGRSDVQDQVIRHVQIATKSHTTSKVSGARDDVQCPVSTGSSRSRYPDAAGRRAIRGIRR